MAVREPTLVDATLRKSEYRKGVGRPECCHHTKLLVTNSRNSIAVAGERGDILRAILASSKLDNFTKSL